jgi:putative transposase
VRPDAGDARVAAADCPLPGLPGGGLTDRPELTDELLDELLGGARTAREIAGPDGLLGQLTRRLLERVLEAEITEHVGYEHGHAPPGATGNARNGRPPKTVLTDHGAVRIRSPRDRNGTFEPQIVAKRQTRWVGFDEKVIALYARGMTVRDIQSHLAERRRAGRCTRASHGFFRSPYPGFDSWAVVFAG